MTMVMAAVKFMAIPVRERVRRFGHTCVPSGGGHKPYVHLYVATYEVMVHAKCISPI
jgi:hypothetical protein